MLPNDRAPVALSLTENPYHFNYLIEMFQCVATVG